MKKIQNSFTLVELVMVVGIMIILVALAVPSYRFFEREADLANSAEEIVNTLRLAQNKTLASEEASRWGVYFSTSINQYTLFKGNDYASRAASFDDVHNLKKSTEIYDIILDGGQEVVFDRVTGNTNQSGSISLRLKSDLARTKTIYVENSGQVGLTVPLIPSDAERKKDTRHVHFDYSGRTIATSTEILTLTCSITTKDIIIAENLKNNQIYWEGEVSVAGELQRLKIHTHRLNDLALGTQFCVHRDRRYNTKALTITISGDGSGNLISYTASGDISTGTSIYVSNLQIQ